MSEPAIAKQYYFQTVYCFKTVPVFFQNAFCLKGKSRSSKFPPKTFHSINFWIHQKDKKVNKRPLTVRKIQ